MQQGAKSYLHSAALTVGYFVQEDPRGRLYTGPASGYMYYAERVGDPSRPIGKLA
jgi:hypothetical protein